MADHFHFHSCHDDNNDSDRNYGHGSGDHDHSGKSHSRPSVSDNGELTVRSTDDLTPALQYSLYRHIEFDKITTLNESVEGSGASVVKKSWDERLDTTRILESDADQQLLMFIPFVFSISYYPLPV